MIPTVGHESGAFRFAYVAVQRDRPKMNEATQVVLVPASELDQWLVAMLTSFDNQLLITNLTCAGPTVHYPMQVEGSATRRAFWPPNSLNTTGVELVVAF